jgi:hypothetical protein
MCEGARSSAASIPKYRSGNEPLRFMWSQGPMSNRDSSRAASEPPDVRMRTKSATDPWTFRSYQPPITSAGTVTSSIRGDQSCAVQYSSKSGWASQSSIHRPGRRTGWAATGVGSFRASGSSRAPPSCINVEVSVLSPRFRDRCSS